MTYDKMRSDGKSFARFNLLQTQSWNLVVIDDLIGDSPPQVNDLEVQATLGTELLENRKGIPEENVSFCFEIYALHSESWKYNNRR